jgi:hypothetical protein
MHVLATNQTVVKFPYSVGQLRRDNPNTSFPKDIPDGVLADFGVFKVTNDVRPEYDPATHYIEASETPVLKNGGWVLPSTVIAFTSEQIADQTTERAKRVRAERDKLLADTDWMALSDVTMSAEMATYRQALRDITAQAGFPHGVTWPTKPE